MGPRLCDARSEQTIGGREDPVQFYHASASASVCGSTAPDLQKTGTRDLVRCGGGLVGLEDAARTTANASQPTFSALTQAAVFEGRPIRRRGKHSRIGMRSQTGSHCLYNFASVGDLLESHSLWATRLGIAPGGRRRALTALLPRAIGDEDLGWRLSMGAVELECAEPCHLVGCEKDRSRRSKGGGCQVCSVYRQADFEYTALQDEVKTVSRPE